MKKFEKKMYHVNNFVEDLTQRNFIGFFLIQSIDMKQKIKLKILAKQVNCEIKFVKNNLIKFALKNKFLKLINLNVLSTGSSILIMSEKNEKCDLVFLKNFFKTFPLESTNSSFLTAIFNQTIINKNFVKKINDIKNYQDSIIDIITLLSNVCTTPISLIKKNPEILIKILNKKTN